MMIKALYIFAFALFFSGLLYQFVALQIFNVFVPKDVESEAVARNVSYGRFEEQTLDIYRPKTFSVPPPVLIFVHGGSWKDGRGADYEFVGRAFAAQGYLTLVINYRLLPRHEYPAFVQDVATALAWAHDNAAHYGGDGEKLFAVGHSAGAYNVAQAILDAQYLRDAGLDPKFIKAVATLAGPFDFLPLDSPLTIAAFGQVKELATTQPINYARSDAPPFLLLHGTADSTVYPKNSRSLYRHLIDSGGRATLKEYDGAAHAGIMLNLAKPLRKNAPVLRDIVTFFRDTAK